MAEGAGGPVVMRLLLGTQLRRLRESRGITAQQAARAIRGSASKISRIERGRTSVRELDIVDLLTLYGITGTAEREELLSLASQANQRGWWHQDQDVLPSWFHAYLDLEESAESIRSYDAQFIPGLLQTEDYASAVIGRGECAKEVAERLVYLRKERQRRFASRGLRLWAIVNEAALRRPVGGPQIMCAQFRYLSDALGQPGFTLQVVPDCAAAYLAPSSFSIFRFTPADVPDIVYIEQLTSALYLDKPIDSVRYAAAMDKLSRAGAPPEQTGGIIRALLDGMQRWS